MTKNNPSPNKASPLERLQRRQANRQELLNMAIESCKKFGGTAQIDNRYSIVDTEKYHVTAK